MPVSVDWKTEAITDKVTGRTLNGDKVYKVRNVWTKKDMGNTAKAFTASVPAHDVILLRLSK